MGFRLDNMPKQVPKPASGSSDSFLKKDIFVFKKAFSNKLKEDFYTELSVLLNAGLTLKSALELIQASYKSKPRPQQLLKEIVDAIVAGQSFSKAISNHDTFSLYEYYAIKIGEETGTLGIVTEQLGHFYFQKNEQRRQLIGSLTYPILILSTAILVVWFMLSFVVPLFQDVFEQQQVELPWITKIIIHCSSWIKQYGVLVLVFALLIIVSLKILKKNKLFQQWSDRLLLKLPFTGSFVKLLYLAQFTQAMTLLTTAKIPLVQAIQLVKKMHAFYPLAHALEQVAQSLVLGNSLSQSIKQHAFFEAKMVALIQVAEETNQNEFIFKRLHQIYKAQVAQRAKLLSTLLEPFIILVVGILVGVILIAMYMPMFKLSAVLG